jgi:hypothetical protein
MLNKRLSHRLGNFFDSLRATLPGYYAAYVINGVITKGSLSLQTAAFVRSMSTVKR